MEKLTKYSKIIDNFLKIFQVFLIVVGGIVVLLSMVGLLLSSKMTELINSNNLINTLLERNNIYISNVKVSITASQLRGLFFALLCIIMIVILIYYVICRLRIILVDMKAGKPFSQNMPSEIRKLSFSIFAYSILSTILPTIITFWLFKVFEINKVIPYLNDNYSVGYHFNIDIITIFIGFIVLFLSLVFEYGAKLQKESDETL